MCFHEAKDLISNLNAFVLGGLGLDELLQGRIRALQDLTNAFVFEMGGVLEDPFSMQRVLDTFVPFKRALMLRDFFGAIPDLHDFWISDDLD